ncbi:lysozyme [bacterium]|nr:lysozyme [bacterium]
MKKQNLFQNAAQILYGKKDDEEQSKNKERSDLLNELGNDLTPAQILYSTNDDLKRIKKEGKNFTPIEELYKRNPNLKPKEEIFDNRKLSDGSLEKVKKFLKKEEGYSENAYQDTGGVWTIGYGHTKNVKPGDKITKEQADNLFREDLSVHTDSLKHVKIKLSENEKAALSSFIYNIGGTRFYNSDMLKKLNNGDKKGAANEFERWVYDNKKIQKGLVNRRKAEKELFLTPDGY